MDAIVLGNVTLDILCCHVEAVPRYDSLPFDKAVIAPGGCGSNVAVGLCALGIATALAASVAAGEAYAVMDSVWRSVGLDTRFIMIDENGDPAVSVGLIDRQAQPRFIHTPGANRGLTVDVFDRVLRTTKGTRFLHVAGFFALPGLLDGRLPESLETARALGLATSLDVINSPYLDAPDLLWSCLPHLDYFFCNLREGQRLTRCEEASVVAGEIRLRQAGAVIVKLGEKGCWLDCSEFQGMIPTEPRKAVDTTGAGDAFAAGFIAALLEGSNTEDACRAGHRAAARIVASLGAVAGWFQTI